MYNRQNTGPTGLYSQRLHSNCNCMNNMTSSNFQVSPAERIWTAQPSHHQSTKILLGEVHAPFYTY